MDKMPPIHDLSLILRGYLPLDHPGCKKWILWIVPFILYVGLIYHMPLMEPDEGRYSLIPSTMNRTGDYITPHLKEVVYIEKPPLAYWATAAAFKVFGENPFSSRLFSALCAWGCILLAWRIGRYFHDEKTGLYAAAVLTMSLYHLAIGRINILDMPLALFVCLAVWAGFRYLAGPARKSQLYLFYFFCGLAFLTKGLIGIVFPGAILVLWLLVSRRWRDIFRLVSLPGMAILLAVSLPWIVLVQMANPDFLWFFFVREHFLRYTTTMHHRNETVFYFIPVLLAGVIPWLGYFAQAGRGIRGLWGRLFNGEEKRFLITWILFVFLFFSVSSSKLIPYIAPLFVPLAVLIGHALRTYEEHYAADSGPMGWKPADYLPVFVQTALFYVALVAPVYIAKQRVSLEAWWPWIVIPALVLILFLFLPELVRRKYRRGWFLTIYTVAGVFFATLTFPIAHYAAPFKSAYPVVQAMKVHIPPGQVPYQFNTDIYGIDFYARMRTPIVDDIGELDFGVARIPEGERKQYFLMSPDFFRLYRDGKEMYVITEGKGNLLRLKQEAPDMRILWNNGNYQIILLKKQG